MFFCLPQVQGRTQNHPAALSNQQEYKPNMHVTGQDNPPLHSGLSWYKHDVFYHLLPQEEGEKQS